jgi:hypothetical protein
MDSVDALIEEFAERIRERISRGNICTPDTADNINALAELVKARALNTEANTHNAYRDIRTSLEGALKD